MTVVLVMGVSGSGKTTVGRTLARELGAVFLEGDRFHPESNIAKMARGEPLDDTDRWPWLDRLAGELARASGAGESVVLACSALKRSYRDRLRRGAPELCLVFLRGSKALIRERLQARTEHFMPAGLLDSQFAALEEPTPDERPITIHIGQPAEAIVAGIINVFKVQQAARS